jgi:hypothetical protein
MENKLVGKWHCYWKPFDDVLANMTYIFRADGTYDYKNHKSGFESKSWYTVEGNKIQRKGSTAFEFKFLDDGRLSLLLGEGNNAAWYDFETLFINQP